MLDDSDYNESTYKFNPDLLGSLRVHEIPATWHDARLRCKLEGGNLASPVNIPLYKELARIVSEQFPNGMYTGLHATFSKGDYFSVEGIPLAHTPIKWSTNEPDNYKNSEECIVLHSNGTAADVNCTNVFPYVCFKPGAPNPNWSRDNCGSTDNGYTLDEKTGSCYKIHTVGRTWSRAFMSCAAEGAHLAIINSDLEAKALKELFAKHPDSEIAAYVKYIASLGFHNWGEFQVWTTIHGQSIQEAGYSTFEKGQPDNWQQGPYCGAMFRSGGLDDLDCNLSAPYICEKPLEEMPNVSVQIVR
ncbi:macrophage mannose receptor 1-like [Battus philenor]|uniref:macrophage mannose receptor 1-like n=1 Tax=Battus philenor TaxID=42288 RepID=UPI0035D051B4